MPEGKPHIAQKGPIKVAVEAGKSHFGCACAGVPADAGKTYYWCACGLSRDQPMCDGSHKGTDFRPLMYTAEAAGDAWFCACKQTGTPPLCDGTHKNL